MQRLSGYSYLLSLPLVVSLPGYRKWMWSSPVQWPSVNWPIVPLSQVVLEKKKSLKMKRFTRNMMHC